MGIAAEAAGGTAAVVAGTGAAVLPSARRPRLGGGGTASGFSSMVGPAGAVVAAATRSLALRFLEGGAPAPPEPAAAVAPGAALACATPSEVAFNGRLLRAEAGASEAAATVGAGAAAAVAAALLPPL